MFDSSICLRHQNTLMITFLLTNNAAQHVVFYSIMTIYCSKHQHPSAANGLCNIAISEQHYFYINNTTKYTKKQS